MTGSRDADEFAERLATYHDRIAPSVADVLRGQADETEEVDLEQSAFPRGPWNAASTTDQHTNGSIPPAEVDRLSRQATYLLVDQLLFAEVLAERDPATAAALTAVPSLSARDPSDPAWVSAFWSALEHVFERVAERSGHPVFDPSRSPLAAVPLEDAPDACVGLAALLEDLRAPDGPSARFDGTRLAGDYEALIQPEHRWRWGQTYTPPAVTRLITRWAVTDPDARVLDPACGTGRFLLTAYRRLAELKRAADGADRPRHHREILEQVYGVEIDRFPAQLAALSLAAAGPDAVPLDGADHVNVAVDDFFSFPRTATTDARREAFDAAERPAAPEGDQTGLSIDGPLGTFDAVTMNPPYTRQEALADDYKAAVRDVALEGPAGESIAMSNRAGLYAYFITHAASFLTEGGRLGMVVGNSWLDVDYGTGLQDFLLDTFRIVAILGTRTDRLIPSADVNTVVVLLERESDPVARDDNEVRFVRLDGGPERLEREVGWDSLLDAIEEGYSPTDEVRIVSRTQGELRDSGTRSVNTTGGTWGTYVRAPDCYFQLLDVAEDRLTPLGDRCEVERGLTTGANEFFYLPRPGSSNALFRSAVDEATGDLLLDPADADARAALASQGFEAGDHGEGADETEPLFRIELEYWMHRVEGEPESLEEAFDVVFPASGRGDDAGCRGGDDTGDIDFDPSQTTAWVPNYVLHSPREVDTLAVRPGDLGQVVLMIDGPRDALDPGVEAYVSWGETWEPSRGGTYADRRTCAARGRWYELPDKRGRVFWTKAVDAAHYAPYCDWNLFVDNRFYTVRSNSCSDAALAAVLNSYVTFLVTEVEGRVNLGEGALDRMVYEVREYPVVDLEAVDGVTVDSLEWALDGLDGEIRSVFAEVGTEDTAEVELGGVLDGVRELDSVVMGEVCGLSDREQEEVYRAVLRMVRERRSKARTGD